MLAAEVDLRVLAYSLPFTESKCKIKDLRVNDLLYDLLGLLSKTDSVF